MPRSLPQRLRRVYGTIKREPHVRPHSSIFSVTYRWQSSCRPPQTAFHVSRYVNGLTTPHPSTSWLQSVYYRLECLINRQMFLSTLYVEDSHLPRRSCQTLYIPF